MNYVRISEYELAEAERWINRIPEVAKLNMKKMPSTWEIDARKLKYEERIRALATLAELVRRERCR